MSTETRKFRIFEKFDNPGFFVFHFYRQKRIKSKKNIYEKFISFSAPDVFGSLLNGINRKSLVRSIYLITTTCT